MKNKKGFTLIELLAVITIMGILILVAIPASSYLIKRSKENIYVNNAITFINEARVEQFNDKEKGVFVYRLSDLDVTNNDKSPFADFIWGYVIAVCEKGNCKYYYMSLDKAGNIIGNKITDARKNATYIEPIPVEVIEDKKGRIIIKLSSESLGENSIKNINNESEEAKLIVIYNQLTAAYTNNNEKFSFAIGDETNYKVYSIKEYENIRFIAEENRTPLTPGSVINIEVSYAPAQADGYSETQVRSFVVLEDNDDTVTAIMQKDLYTNNSKRIGLEKKFGSFLLLNEKVKDIRLLEIDDLKDFIPNVETYINSNLLFPHSVIRKLNINNQNSPGAFLTNGSPSIATTTDYTLVCDGKKGYTNQTVTWYYQRNQVTVNNIKLPKDINDCWAISTSVETPSKNNYIQRVPSYNMFRFKLVLVFDKEKIIDEI